MLPERKNPVKKSFAFLLQKLEEELDLQRGVVGQIRAVDAILSLVRPKSGSECPRADMLGNVGVCAVRPRDDKNQHTRGPRQLTERLLRVSLRIQNLDDERKTVIVC